MFIGVLELTYSHNTGLTGADTGQATGIRLAPIFETVYHDYHVTGTFAGLNYPTGDAFYSIPMEIVRQIYAAALFLGRAPWAGSVLSSNTIANAMASDPDYADLIDMVGNYMGVLGKPMTREFVTFGERWRDPEPASSAGTAVLLPQLAPYGAFQPFVYATVYGRPDMNGFGLLLMNWSDDGDPASGAGNQSVTYTLDPTVYGLPAGTYEVREVTASGPVLRDPIDLSSPASFAATVDEREARFFVFTQP